MMHGCLAAACLLLSAVATAAGQCPLAPGDDLTLMFDQSAYTVEEGEIVVVMVELCGNITDDVVVNVMTDNGTAVAGSDYTSVSMDLTFNATTTNQTVMIMTSTDSRVEDEEMFTLSLTTTDSAVMSQSVSTNVSITDMTMIILENPQSRAVLVGEPVEMTCVIGAGFDINIMWSKDDVIVNDSSITTTTTPPSGGVGSYSSVLSISSVTLENCGTYICSAIGVDSNTAELNVVALFNKSNPSPMSSVGAVGMLSCTIRRCGNFSIVWDITSDNGTERPFPINNTTLPMTDTVNELTSVATITTLGVINSGRTQQCVVQYNGTNVTYQVFDYTLENVEVNVTVSPERSGSFIEGDDVTLTCTGVHPPDALLSRLTFMWAGLLNDMEDYVDLTRGDEGRGITVTTTGNTSILSIMNIQEEMRIEGNYTCRVFNRVFNDVVEVTTEIDVIYVPDMVDIITLNSDLLSLLVANISWTAPEYNNAPITSYSLSICNDIECFVETPAVPYLLLFVKPTYTYTINITATNGVGDSVISDEGMFMGAMEIDSMANLTTSLVTDSVVILEWTLPPLANIPDSIKPQTPESQFDVIGYSISILNLPNIDPVYLEGRDNTSYLFSNENGLSPELDRITISLRVNYSLAEINDNIPGVSNLSVDIPSPDDPGAIPDSAKTPAAATNVTEGFGFIISWNVPEVDPVFIEGYEVFINRADLRRRKRQEDPIGIPVSADVTSYTYTTDEASTDFLVRVDGLLIVSGQRGRVPALVETRLRTREGNLTLMFDQPAAYTVDEGGMVDVVVQLCGNVTNDVVVTFMTDDGTAVAGSDYASVSVDRTFSATTTSQTVMIMTTSDSIVEILETFTLSLTSTDSAVMPQPVSTTVSITDMTKVMIDFNQPGYTVTEGQTVMANVQVMSAVTLDRDVVVTVQTVDGSATAVADADYTSMSMMLTITTGTISAGGNLIPTVMIVTSTDSRVENVETFTLSLTTGDSAVMPQPLSTTVSINDTTKMMINFNQPGYTVTEGGTVMANVQVMSEVTLDRDVMVTVQTGDGSATAGADADYTGVSMIQTIPTGTTISAGGNLIPTVMIVTSTDSRVETQETFTLSLTTGDSAVMPQSISRTISINDMTRMMIDFNQPGYTVTEGGTVMANVQVMSEVTLDRDVMVTVQTGDGSATAGADADYTGVSMMLTIPTGTISAGGNLIPTVMIVTSTDSRVENVETFTLSLNTSDLAVMPQSVSSTVSINDTTMVTIGLDSMMYSVTEGRMVTATVSVMSDDVTLERNVVVMVINSSGTADSADFMVAPLALTFDSGTPSQDVVVTALPDTVSEEDEDFSLSLTGDTAVQLNVSTATVTITDATVVLGFSQPSYTFTEGQMMADVVVTVTANPLSRSVPLTIMSVESGNATVGGGDFTQVDEQMNISSSYTFSVSILEDRVVDNNETFSLSLTTDDMGVNIMSNTTVITITDATIQIGLDMMEYLVAEGGSVDVTVAVNGPVTVTGNVTVTLTADPSDFQSTLLTFSSSNMSHTITIPAMTDDIVEGNETVILTLTTSAVNVALNPATAELVIMDRTVIILENPQSRAVLVGVPVDMTCVIGAGFGITIMWSKDDVMVDANDPLITITPMSPSGDVGNYSSVLSISNVTLENCGTYMCSAVGVDSNTVELIATADLNVVALVNTSDPSPMSSVGAVGMLSCTIRRCGNFSIVWDIISDNGTDLPFPVAVTNTTDELTSVVTINTLGVINSGRTQLCVVQYNGTDVTNQVFDYTLENVEVNVTVSPERNGSFIEGDNVTLTCTGVNPPDALLRDLTFMWAGQLNDMEDYVNLTNGNEDRGITVTTTGNTSTLSIMNIQDEMRIEGNYTCRVFNRVFNDVVEVTTEIDVISGPVVIFPSGGDGPRVRQGDDLTVTCFTGGSDPPATFINITSGGQLLADISDPIEGRLEFIITDTSLADHGTVYVCTAVNTIGSTSESFSLIVQDVPDMVDITTLNSDLLTLLVANISWTAPEYNNAPITGYNVSICNDIDGFTTKVIQNPAVPYLLFFVKPTYTYTVNITATNGVGDSDISDEGMFMGAMDIDSMATLTTSLVTDSVVILEWTLPPLATIPDSIKPQTPESQFDVSGYSIFIVDQPNVDPVFLEGRDNTSYLLSEENGLSLEPDRITISLRVNYSRAEINDNIPGETNLLVDIPSPGDAVPVLAETFAAATNVSILEGFGFTITWNVPDVDPAFIEGYEVFINRADLRRRKRQDVPIRRTVNVTSYTFTTDEAFTDFLVRVDGLLRVSGQRGRVPALIETRLRTSEGTSSPPLGLRLVGKAGVTSFNIRWSEPDMPNGVITEYEVLVDGNSEMFVDGRSAHVSGLRGHTEYKVTVRAINGASIRAGDGELTPPLPVLTDAGVVAPSIESVSTNIDLRQYTLTIDGFEDDYGPLSHYVIYAVETDTIPDTSTINPNSDTAYIAIAASAAGRTDRFTEVMGDGRSGMFPVPGDSDVEFNNRALRGGRSYYFFVRLFSSVNVTLFNDSVPMLPRTILPSDKADVVPIIAGVLGVLAFILILVFIALLFIAVCGRNLRGFYIVRQIRRDDGEKGGNNILMHRRTRLFTPVLDVGDPNVFTSAGQPTTLVCEVSGTPEPTIKWTHEGKPLDDERFLVLADHSLFIQDTCSEDEGSYLVTAENSAGVSQAQIKVTVIKPTPPEPDTDHPPVPVDNFTEHFARMSANDGDDLDEEYGDLEPDFAQTSYAAKLSINRNKNRYINIIPYDHSRVVLSLQENTPGSDYINACYINGFKRANQYIASQGPTTSTLADFWRMVWELDCPTIVMVTKLKEDDKTKCEQYWPSYGSTTYGNVQVTLKEAENLAEYSIRSFSVSPLAGQSSAQMPVREVKQFHFLKWPDHGVPNYATALLHFRKRVHNYHPEKRGPMVVHCSAGVGRTGTFITVDYCMELMEGEGVVDIFNFVQQMRYKRNYMVQTPPQYEFIHEAINEAITCGDTSIKAPELKNWLAKLEPDAETGQTVLDGQFKRLESASPQDDEFDCTVAEVNKEKNRIEKHLPSNDQRVILSSENDMSDYICASYVDGYRQRNAFMITQGPMKNTVGDFWRMVWELKSAAIVMLTQLEEDGEEMSQKYWSDEVGEAAVFGMFHVELTSEVRDLGDYCTRKIKLSPIDKAHESRIITQFHFTKWSRSVPPDSAKPMIDMIDELQRVQRKSGNQPITVHCNDGLGRTGTFCTLYYVLDRVKTEQVVDVFQAVKTLRIQRTGLVDNIDQFMFVHKATMEFLDTFSDYQNFK